jgi:hypothetical protein
MVDAPDIETPFRRAARRLITPLAGRFDSAQWDLAYAETPNPTEEDARLLAAAKWVGREVQAHNAARPDRFGPLCAAQAIALGVALLNREHRASVESSKKERDNLPEGQPVSFDYLSNVRYENNYGQRMSATDFLETAVESLSSWIFDARRNAAEAPAESADLAPLARDLMFFYSVRRVLKAIFDEALHQGDCLAPGRDDLWQPIEPNLAELHKAWIARAEAAFMNEPMKLRTTWPMMSPAQRRARCLARSVDAVTWHENGWRGKVVHRNHLSGRPNGCALERTGLRDSYLSLFLDEEMPAAPGLTAALLVDAWWVLTDFARAIERATRSDAARGKLSLLQGAGAVQRKELCRVLASALRISDERAGQVVEFLMFKEQGPSKKTSDATEDDDDKGNRGFWSAPLVPVPDDDVLLLPHPVFEHGDPVYRVEAWLEKGGIDDQAIEHRGDRFEEHYRADLVAAIAGNPLLDGARIAPVGIADTEDFPFQTDLLFKLGGRAFVGEIKCWLTPADPHHWGRFYRVRLKGAVDQVLARTTALGARRDVLANALGIPEKEAASLELCPIVVVNTGAGFSLNNRGCRVIDGDFLRSYLRTPHQASAIAMHFGKPAAQRIESLYATEQEASDRFDEVMADPWTLRRFLDRLERTEVAYPRPSGGSFFLKTLFRGDLTPQERLQHARMMARVQDT